MIVVLIRRDPVETQAHREEAHVKKEAETGVALL